MLREFIIPIYNANSDFSVIPTERVCERRGILIILFKILFFMRFLSTFGMTIFKKTITLENTIFDKLIRKKLNMSFS